MSWPVNIIKDTCNTYLCNLFKDMKKAVDNDVWICHKRFCPCKHKGAWLTMSKNSRHVVVHSGEINKRKCKFSHYSLTDYLNIFKIKLGKLWKVCRQTDGQKTITWAFSSGELKRSFMNKISLLFHHIPVKWYVFCKLFSEIQV